MTGNGFAGRKGLHVACPESHGAAFSEAEWLSDMLPDCVTCVAGQRCVAAISGAR
jgi:hypothetical protein